MATASLGAGFSAAGFSPAGTGDVATVDPPATDDLVDAVGTQRSARALDPSTGQYILNASGTVQGMSRVQQLVLLRVRDLDVLAEGDNDATAQRRLAAKLSTLLADLVTAKLLTILQVGQSADIPTRLRSFMRWKDLTTGEEHRETL